MLLIVLQCGICQAPAGIGVDAGCAQHNVIDSGGRVFGGELHVCQNCARHTR